MRKRARERKGGERFRALESFLRANTDLSTRRHSWKRNLIREKLNSFKCTSRSLFAPSIYPLPPVPLLPPSLRPLTPSPSPVPFGVCNPPSLVLLVFRRLFRLLLLSATHLYSVNPFHCENVVLQFTFPLSLPSYPPYSSRHSPLPLCFSRYLSLCLPPFYASFKDVPLSRSPPPLFFPSLSLHQRDLPPRISFLSLYSRLSIARRALFPEEQLLDFRLFNPLN